MGMLAAEMVLARIAGGAEAARTMVVDPELVVRGSTAGVKAGVKAGGKAKARRIR